jgi:radical SAM superfamily enzyme YgiQ (UPF0313 family)
MKKHKAILLQLPIQSHDFFYSMECFYLAQGYLAGYGRKECEGWEIEVVPQEISNFAGDLALIEWLASQRPDLIGFSCYLWNVERSLYIAEKLKERIPDLIVVIGGPEVTEDNEIISQSKAFDYAISGEGEEIFAWLLNSLKGKIYSKGNLSGLLRKGERFLFPKSLIKDLDMIPSPYLNGIIRPTPIKSIAIETGRGCPYRCIYCYYHKGFPTIRSFSIERIRKELVWAENMGIEEISIVDPSFDLLPQFRSVLNVLKEVRSQSIKRIFCEIVAHQLDRETIQHMKEAGITDVEVGIQTVNQKVLINIRRPILKKGLFNNLKAMREEGIRVQVDIIIGLPGDDLEGIKRTVDYLINMGYFDDVMVFPLSVLPGTELRRKADEMGIIYQKQPPYYVIRTPHMDHEDLSEAFRICEEAFDIDIFPIEYPFIGRKREKWERGKGFITHISFEKDINEGRFKKASSSYNKIISSSIAQSVTIIINEGISFKKVFSLIKRIMEENPFSLFNFVFIGRSAGDKEKIEMAKLKEMGLQHPVNREIYSHERVFRTIQIFSLVRKGNKGGLGLGEMEIPFIEITHEDLQDLPSCFFDYPVCWISIPEGFGENEIRRLIELIKEKRKEGLCELHFLDLMIEALWNPLFPPINEIKFPV